ncbi:MAG: serine/threonine-protein kinase [Anaerolineae bacterium]
METGSVLRHRYHLICPLGRGGMADVFLAFDEKRRAEVAVKVLREDLAEDPEFLERFQREADALARLDHPYVVRFYSLEREGATAFIVMDYVAGSTLRSRLAEAGGPLPLSEVTRIMRQVGSALQYAHNEGFIHRDIKPGNIMLREDGSALLSDFGIARAAEAATMTQGSLGTPAYMSPEQILGRPPDPRTDVYALGVVLYEMLTGRRPFLGDSGTGTSTTERVRDEHLHRDPPDPRLLNPALPPALSTMVTKAMAKDPAERWQSVDEFVSTWSQVAASSTASAGTTAAARPQGPETRGLARIPTAAIVAAAAVVGLALLAVVIVAVVALGDGGGTSIAALATGETATPAALTPTAVTPGAVKIIAASPTVSPSSAATATVSATPVAATDTPIAATATTGGTVIAASAATETATPTALPTATDTPAPPTETPTPSPTATEPPAPVCATGADPELAGMWDQAVMGCALAPSTIAWSAWQSFQSGAMLWHSDTNTVSILFGSGSYSEVNEPWDESTPNPSRGDPPAGLYAPVRGFGFLWGTYDYVYTGLGWATDEEKGFCALVQRFDGGYLLRSSTVEFCQDSLFNWARDPSFVPVAIRVLGDGTWQGY